MRSKIVRRLPSWQRSDVVSQQRLRLRRFDSLVKRSPELRSEPVSFLFLVFFSIRIIFSCEFHVAMELIVILMNIAWKVKIGIHIFANHVLLVTMEPLRQ